MICDGITLDIVSKRPEQHTFVVVPRRWVVERILATLERARRRSKDYQHRDLTSEAIVHLASIQSLLRRMAPGLMTSARYRFSSRVI
jgi:putative transposase